MGPPGMPKHPPMHEPPPRSMPPPPRPMPPPPRPMPPKDNTPSPTITIHSQEGPPKPGPPPKPLMGGPPGHMEPPPHGMPPRPPNPMLHPPPAGRPPMMPPPGDMGGMMQPPPLMPPPPGMMMPPPPGQMMPPPHMQQSRPPQSMDNPDMMMQPPKPHMQQDDDEPLSKKSKLDSMEADLVPEQMFIKQKPSSVTFRVQVPDLPDKSDWQCQGQVLSISAQLSDAVSVYNVKTENISNFECIFDNLALYFECRISKNALRTSDFFWRFCPLGTFFNDDCY